MAEGINLETLWQEVNQALHRGPINRPFWEAARAAVPLAIEDETLILGFQPKDMRHASYLETTVNKNRIQEVLQARTGKRMDIKCIEGATAEAWENTKAREREQEDKLRADYVQLRAHRTSLEAWGELSQRLTNLYATTRARSLPIVQATLLVKCLPMLFELDTELRSEDPDATMLHDRELNRLFDKIATFCDLPACQVALEYMRFRSSRKS